LAEVNCVGAREQIVGPSRPGDTYCVSGERVELVSRVGFPVPAGVEPHRRTARRRTLRRKAPPSTVL